ncbi:MAG: alpha/beta fold hydrolase [Deltaproteobacteria bacterium]|nr:alpha/beta fold hydrolase [Deltaproteobacteria bacterium]
MTSRVWSYLAVGLCGLTLVSCGKTQQIASQEATLAAKKGYTERHHRIAMADGTKLGTSIFTPDPVSFPGKRPAILMGSSWALNEWEYDGPAREFARDGYVVLNFAPRGFGISGGRVGVASGRDIQDISELIDWLVTNTPTDGTKIAMAGVSYGAGLGLLAAAHDERIKAVVALSGWGNLIEALAPNESGRQVAMSLLVGSGTLFGRLDPQLYQLVDDLKQHRNVDTLRAWARVRSPLTYIDRLNARGVAIMIGNSYQDSLFPPNQVREFYEKLTGPKMLYMDHGIHAVSAVPGMFGMPSEIWFDVHAWFDYHLLGKESEVIKRPPVSFGTDHGREYYAQIPQPSSAESAVFRLKTLNKVVPKETPSSRESHIPSVVIRLIGNIDSAATSGIPLLSDAADAYLRLPVMQAISFINKSHAAIYLSEPMGITTNIRGMPRVTVNLEPHRGPVQLASYLYDVDRNNIGRLITHGIYSRYEPNPSPASVSTDMFMAAYDVPAGHRIAIAIDTRDPLYVDPTPETYQLEINHSPHQEATVSLPTVNFL